MKKNPLDYAHEPNLCIVHIVCQLCMDQPLCHRQNCGPNRRVFKGPETANRFCEFLFDMKHVIAFAHNAQGFDGHFIMQYLQNQDMAPKIITRGLKIMSLQVGSARLIDSFNFLPMALSAMPKAFGEPELKKGYFPPMFNTEENQSYKGKWPDASFYSPASMSPKARDTFYAWYNQQTGKTFDFQAEFMAYCESDVDILRRCCLKCRYLFIDETNIDPFAKNCTIAGACNRVYRTHYLKPDTIGIVPHGGYRRADKQSIKALKWLKWLSHNRNIHIRHARNDIHGERQIGQYKVDGACGVKVFEFHGCYWHGCPKCIVKRGQLTADHMHTVKEAYTRTLKRKKELQQAGWIVEEIWECEYERQLKDDPQMKAFIDAIDIMDPREAFFGGRTNAVKLQHKAANNEKIMYTDICSLYPTVNKYGLYPIGHPTILTENFKPISITEGPYNGLIKVTVLPPRRLYHPFLQYRSGGKLLFPLCRTCARDQQRERCQHNNEERAMTGA